jgi:peptidoglycan/LPS O-acetylase OafA/YrhL
MPEPIRAGQRYLPGLDGLRALAVLAVVAYHLGLSWAPGGLLGVGVFFTLSGYLITDLLLGAHARTGSLQLADFWLRRARRLLPALFVMIAVVVAWVALLDRAQLAGLRGAVAAAATYVSNWYLIGEHTSYFAQFGPPSPLGHLWSLAVEEQFYLVWPGLLLLFLFVARPRRGTGTRAAAGTGSGRRYVMAAVTLLLAAASALAMAALYHPGYDPTRVYDGTDTRAFALLLGAALAFLWPTRQPRREVGAVSRWCLDGVGVIGLVVIGALIWRTSEYSAFLYRGGLVVLSLATVLVLAAVVAPAGRLGLVLGAAPLRWIGVRSYGIYLWHFPIIALTTPAGGHDPASRAVLQVVATIVVAALSWHYIEEPVRHGALGRWWAQLRGRPADRAAGRAPRRRTWGPAAGLAGGAAAVALAGACLAGVVPALPASVARPATEAAASGPGSRSAGLSDGSAPRPASGTGAQDRPRPVLDNGKPRTSCQSVVHIGDSTSEGLISADYLPKKWQRIGAQYRKVGVRHVHFKISGARSIVETWDGQPNAHTVAEQLKAEDYHGCWVLALGTNDTADVYVGSPVSLAARIRQMMAVIGGQPVMWVNVISLPEAPADYAEAQMEQWNQALVRACAAYPNMRVFDWAADAKPWWFISDGIHYTSAGYAARSRLIARALAQAFPAGGRSSSSCLIQTPVT